MSKHIFLYCVHICSILLLILLWPDLQMNPQAALRSSRVRACTDASAMMGPGPGVSWSQSRDGIVAGPAGCLPVKQDCDSVTASEPEPPGRPAHSGSDSAAAATVPSCRHSDPPAAAAARRPRPGRGRIRRQTRPWPRSCASRCHCSRAVPLAAAVMGTAPGRRPGPGAGPGSGFTSGNPTPTINTPQPGISQGYPRVMTTLCLTFV